MAPPSAPAMTMSPGSTLNFEAFTTNAQTGACFQADDISIIFGPPIPGVTVTESDTVNVVEGGGTDSYSIVLDSTPTDDVDITITPDSQTDLGAGAGVPVVLTFTPGNALTPQSVFVTAADDSVFEG